MLPLTVHTKCPLGFARVEGAVPCQLYTRNNAICHDLPVTLPRVFFIKTRFQLAPSRSAAGVYERHWKATGRRHCAKDRLAIEASVADYMWVMNCKKKIHINMATRLWDLAMGGSPSFAKKLIDYDLQYEELVEHSPNIDIAR